MKVLLDTHAFVWSLTAPERLSEAAIGAIADNGNAVFVSSATAWELAIKYRLGKLPQAEALLDDFEQHASDLSADILFMSHRHAIQAGLFDADHRDPFDRMLAAQARCEDLVLISRDAAFGQFDVRVVW
jgi:PIN domain nuclease of toxin-antitoxin system